MMITTTTPIQNKVIFIDFSVYMFKSIFYYERDTKKIPPPVMFYKMLVGDLKKVGVKPEDTVIVAIDSPKGSWRKEIDHAYKGNRKAEREKHNIDWDKMWKIFDFVKEEIESCTPFHIIEADKLEADDIISYGCRKFSDKECIVISIDADYEQLTAFPNVKLFSTSTKRFKHIKNPYLVLTSKIKKEKSDNLLTEVHNELDFEKRNLLINLLSLPKEIETKADEKLEFIPEKEWNYEGMKYPSTKSTFSSLYFNQGVVDYNKESKKERKDRIKKKKREEEKMKKLKRKEKDKMNAKKKQLEKKLNKQKELFE